MIGVNAAEAGSGKVGVVGKSTNNIGSTNSNGSTNATSKSIVIDSQGKALIGEWSATTKLTSPANAEDHWLKYVTEFPEFSNAAQYVEGAQNFMTKPLSNTLSKVRLNGGTLYYEAATSTFAVKNSAGEPRTMFRPADEINYWNKQWSMDCLNARVVKITYFLRMEGMRFVLFVTGRTTPFNLESRIIKTGQIILD